jgi:hypothetical protein
MRPVVGVQFRKNALDSALDGVLGDGELIGNLLVRVSAWRSDASTYDFCVRQALIAHVLRDLERDLGR